LKYDETRKLPYSALIERLRKFIETPDSLLIACGFSFNDAHLTAVIDESLSANRAAAVLALQFGTLASEGAPCALAQRRANMSVCARDGAVIDGVKASWRLGDLPHPAWGPIRESFWGKLSGSDELCFTLGDFSSFAQYAATTRVAHERLQGIYPVDRAPPPTNKLKAIQRY
jgi:hypothetical protein